MTEQMIQDAETRTRAMWHAWESADEATRVEIVAAIRELDAKVRAALGL